MCVQIPKLYLQLIIFQYLFTYLEWERKKRNKMLIILCVHKILFNVNLLQKFYNETVGGDSFKIPEIEFLTKVFWIWVKEFEAWYIHLKCVLRLRVPAFQSCLKGISRTLCVPWTAKHDERLSLKVFDWFRVQRIQDN